MRKKQTLPLGTISEATLRPEDVVPELIWSLKQVAPRKASKYQREFDAVPEDDPDGILDELWSEISDTLEEYAPPFCYVGANEGDGACIGVWISDDALDQAIQDGEVWKDPDDGSKMPKTASYRLVVSDHGNMTLYSRRGRELWGIV